MDSTVCVDRLRSGAVDEISLEIEPEESGFAGPIEVKGEAYLAGDHLVLQLRLHTHMSIPCKICGAQLALPLGVEELRQVIPLEEIPSAVYDFGPLVVESALLEAPPYAECGGGSCPRRDEIMKRRGEAPGFRPFEDL